MFQAIRQSTKEDHAFDRSLLDGYRLAEKGLDWNERLQVQRARVRLLLYPELAPAERERLEAELHAIEDKAAATLDPEERDRLEEAKAAAYANVEAPDDELELSLRRHVESAELRLGATARDRLIQARRGGADDVEIGEIEQQKEAIEEKAWVELGDDHKIALRFFEDSIPSDPEAREALFQERSELEEKAVQSLPEHDQAQLRAHTIRRRAEASLSEDERKHLRESGDGYGGELKMLKLQAQAEECLNAEERTVLLRARLLERRESAEKRLPAGERRELEKLRAKLKSLREREDLERRAESRLSDESRARLDHLRATLGMRKDLISLQQQAERSLTEEERERLRRLRAQLRVSPEERERLQAKIRRLAFGNLSGQGGTFAPGVSEREALQRANDYLDEVLRISPFNTMLDGYALEEDEQSASRLFDLLLRDTRFRTFTRTGEKRDAIVRQGDYGSTAFLIFTGRVRILIQTDEQAAQTAAARGSTAARRRGWLGLLARWLKASPGREVRSTDRDARYAAAREAAQEASRPVIKNFAKIPAVSKEHTLGEGEVFGEIAALTRTPRTATVVPDTDEVRLLEIRWQGLRELIASDESFERYVEERYRDSSRRAYVFRTGLFAGVGDTPAIREELVKGDFSRLFRYQLGWHGARPRESFPATFRVPSIAPPPLSCRLRVWREGKQESIALPDQVAFTIGADEGCSLTLPKRPTVSEHHLELRRVHGRYYLRNLSRHGTVLDGARVTTRAVLYPGAKFRVGDGFWFMFEADNPAAAPGTPEVEVTLFAESPRHNGIGGIKAYHCRQVNLPSDEVCAAISAQVRRREYFAREESRHVVIVQGTGAGAQVWRWLVPSHDEREPQANEEGSFRLRGDVTPLIDQLIKPLALEEVIKVTEFASFGKFRWFDRSPEEAQEGTHWSARLDKQPLIASQGHYPNGVYMIRAGFARLTKETDQGEQTVSYLRPEAPYGYGLEEVIENFLSKREELVKSARMAPKLTLPFSLRAVGYADTVFFPTSVLERFVLPTYREQDLLALVRGEQSAPEGLHALETVADEVPDDLRDFLVDHHLINGTQSMVINLDRCTRCDDCVRGCASTHDRDPRFIRHGLTHGNLMVTNACMHCVDPVCLIDCPTGAIHRPLGGGLVVIDDPTCIGCSACAHNCPYDNIRMVPIRSPDEAIVVTRDEEGQIGDVQVRATKCDLCYDQNVKETACVRACPHDALRRVDLSDLGNLADLAKWLE